MKKSDAWCKPLRTQSGLVLYGGAARNVRIKARGGMEQIIHDVTEHALYLADTAAGGEKFPPLRRVK